jgi:hypothetical protein
VPVRQREQVVAVIDASTDQVDSHGSEPSNRSRAVRRLPRSPDHDLRFDIVGNQKTGDHNRPGPSEGGHGPVRLGSTKGELHRCDDIPVVVHPEKEVLIIVDSDISPKDDARHS